MPRPHVEGRWGQRPLPDPFDRCRAPRDL